MGSAYITVQLSRIALELGSCKLIVLEENLKVLEEGPWIELSVRQFGSDAPAKSCVSMILNLKFKFRARHAVFEGLNARWIPVCR